MTMNSAGYCNAIAATPMIDADATSPTPSSSPGIIHRVRFTPIVIPSVMERVMHIPGVRETRKNVGMSMVIVAEFTRQVSC